MVEREIEPFAIFDACYRVFVSNLLDGARVTSTPRDDGKADAARALLVSLLGERTVEANEKQLRQSGAALRAAIERAAAHNSGQILMSELYEDLIQRDEKGEMGRVIRRVYRPAP